MFEDDFPFPNVNYVSFLEGTSLSPPTHPLQRYRIHFFGANILRERVEKATGRLGVGEKVRGR